METIFKKLEQCCRRNGRSAINEVGDILEEVKDSRERYDIVNMNLSGLAHDTLLHLCAVRNKPLMISDLISNGAQLIGTQEVEDSPLHLAAHVGHDNCVSELLGTRHGDDDTCSCWRENLRKKNLLGRTPYEEALYNNTAMNLKKHGIYKCFLLFV